MTAENDKTVAARLAMLGAAFIAVLWGFQAMLLHHAPSIFTNPQEDMGYGWYVPLFSIYVAWSERKKIWNALSAPEPRGPRMVFRSRKNLKAVVRNKVICHKFAKELTSHFHWRGSDEIVIYDDSLPYSFFFEERINGRTGICGGIIFHNEDNDLAKASYGVHT